MANPIDAVQAEHKTENHTDVGIAAKIASEVADFGEGVYHGAVESPINGAVQLANHIAGAHLPELHLVDEQRLSHTAGGVIGNMAGTALDVYALTALTAGVGGAVGGSAMLGTALKFGAVGAAYTGLLQPTDGNSQHFFKDRLENTAIAAGTYAAMGGAGALLDRAGVFAVSSARSLAGNLTYGGLMGAVGGVAHAESSAVIKDGKALPTLAHLGSDVGNYAAFGAAFGAINYAANKVSPSETKTFTTDRASTSVTLDKTGNPVKLDGNLPAIGDDYLRIRYQSTKMTDGTWQSKAWEALPTGEEYKILRAADPRIQDVKIDGDDLSVTGHGIERLFKGDGQGSGTYTRTDLHQVELTAKEQAARQADFDKYNKSTVSDDVKKTSTYTSWDDQHRLEKLSATSADGNTQLGSASIYYGKDGALSQVSINQPGQPDLHLMKTDGGSWYFTKDGQDYKFNGDVALTPKTSSNGGEQIQITPTYGQATTVDLTGSGTAANNVVDAHADYLPGHTGRTVMNVDAQGNTTLTAGTNGWQKLDVNGKPIAPGQAVAVKPGDQVNLTNDEGDTYPIWEKSNLTWGHSADGQPTLGNLQLKPNTHLDLAQGNNGGKLIANAK